MNRMLVEHIYGQIKADLALIIGKHTSYISNFSKLHRRFWHPAHWHLGNKFSPREKTFGWLQRCHPVGPHPDHPDSPNVVILGYSVEDRIQLESVYLQAVRPIITQGTPAIEVLEATAYAIDLLPNDYPAVKRLTGQPDESPYNLTVSVSVTDNGTEQFSGILDLPNWNSPKHHFLKVLENCLNKECSPKTQRGSTAGPNVQRETEGYDRVSKTVDPARSNSSVEKQVGENIGLGKGIGFWWGFWTEMGRRVATFATDHFGCLLAIVATVALVLVYFIQSWRS